MPRSAWSFRDLVKEQVGQERDTQKRNSRKCSMKSPALALIMIVVILTSNCVRNIPRDRQPNLIILLDKEFVKQHTQYEWWPREWFNSSSLSRGGGGGGTLGISPAAGMIELLLLAGAMVWVSGHVITHNVEGTNVSLIIDGDAWQETYELNWGTNRFFLSEEKLFVLENGTAKLRLVATGTRELELGVPTEGMRIKRDVHNIEFTKSGDIIVDGTGITSSDEQTGPQPASEEDLSKRPQESGQDDKESQN